MGQKLLFVLRYIQTHRFILRVGHRIVLMFNLVGPLGFKRLIYCISTPEITGNEFQNRACYSVLAAAVLFSTAVCVYIFLVLLVVDFLVTAKSENKHISFHRMYVFSLNKTFTYHSYGAGCPRKSIGVHSHRVSSHSPGTSSYRRFNSAPASWVFLKGLRYWFACRREPTVLCCVNELE